MPVECSRLGYLNRLSMHVPTDDTRTVLFPPARLYIHYLITPTCTPTTTDGLFCKCCPHLKAIRFGYINSIDLTRWSTVQMLDILGDTIWLHKFDRPYMFDCQLYSYRILSPKMYIAVF